MRRRRLDESSTTATLTKDEFVQQANAICAETSEEIDAAATEAQASGGDQEAFITDTLRPSVEAQLTRSRRSGPGRRGGQIAAIVDAANQGLDEAQADPTALTSGGIRSPRRTSSPTPTG